MNAWRVAIVASLLGLCGSQAFGQQPTSSVFELVPMRKQFEERLARVRSGETQLLAAVRSDYITALDVLAATARRKGATADSASIRDERARFLRDQELPTGDAVDPASDLGRLQTQVAARLANVPQTTAKQVVGVVQKYFKDLAALEKRCETAHNPIGIRRVKEERERVTNDEFIKEALAKVQATSEPAAPTPPPEPPPPAPANGDSALATGPKPGAAPKATRLAAAATGATDKPPNLEIVVLKGATTKMDYSMGDEDDMTDSFRFTIKVRNKEKRDFSQLTVIFTVYARVLGGHGSGTTVDNGRGTFDLPGQGEFTLQGQPVTLSYDKNFGHGTRYDGYAVIVKDASGQVVASKANKPPCLKMLLSAETAQ